MTITKNSTYYVISGDVNNVEVSGNITTYEGGGLYIDINLANNISANFTKNADGTMNLGVNYSNASTDVDFVQQIISDILEEIDVTPVQTQD